MKLSLWMLWVAMPLFAAGKSADDYYHGAAYKYIAGRMQEASVDVDEGLRTYPGDAHLQALADLLKQMKDQQKQDQNQSGGGQNQDKSKPDSSQQNKSKSDGKNGNNDQQKPNSKNDQDKKDQDKKDQDKKDQDKKDQPQKNQGTQDSSGQDQQKDEQKDARDSARDSSQGGQPPKAGKMSKEDAERLLNSYQEDEKKEQRDRQQPTGKRATVEQDW